MSSQHDQPPQAGQPPARERSAMDWVKLILDFLSKAFYPAIIIYVLLLLKPSLAQIDVPSLINRLQSASVGGAELTFNQAEDVAVNIAPLNGRVAEFELTVAQLRTEIAALQERSGIPAAAIEPSPEQLEKERRFEKNSGYTVLVFHAPSAEASQRAAKITRSLLNWGYPASSTETEFSELKGDHPPGSVLVTYNETGAKVLDTVLDLARKNSPGATVNASEKPISLRRGELQVLVF